MMLAVELRMGGITFREIGDEKQFAGDRMSIALGAKPRLNSHHRKLLRYNLLNQTHLRRFDAAQFWEIAMRGEITAN